MERLIDGILEPGILAAEDTATSNGAISTGVTQGNRTEGDGDHN